MLPFQIYLSLTKTTFSLKLSDQPERRNLVWLYSREKKNIHWVKAKAVAMFWRSLHRTNCLSSKLFILISVCTLQFLQSPCSKVFCSVFFHTAQGVFLCFTSKHVLVFMCVQLPLEMVSFFSCLHIRYVYGTERSKLLY